jgi:preprotein translocase subunit SecB
MNSPLQLKEHRFTQFSVEAIATGLPGAGTQVKTQYSVGRSDTDKHLWRVILKAEFGPSEEQKACPYRGHVEMIGWFAVSEKWPEDKTEELVKVNGASILYGAIREMLLTVTARSSHDAFMLPTMSFASAVKAEPEAAPKSQPTKAPPAMPAAVRKAVKHRV